MSERAHTKGRERPILFSAPMVRALPHDEIAARYCGGQTMAEIAAAYGVSRPSIAKCLQASGVESRPAKRRPGVGCGDRNSAWKGGRRQRKDGYWVVWTPEGERLEHRVAAEQALGRPLSDREIVHHRDGNKANNAPENLEVMSQREHARLHSPEMHARRYGHGR